MAWKPSSTNSPSGRRGPDLARRRAPPAPRPDARRTLADMDIQGDSNMQAAHQAQVTFYLTGLSTGEGLDAVAGLGLRPALLTFYRDLTALRYDFPLVLLPGASDAGAVRSLTELFDAALEAALDPALDGETGADRLRH